jgi:hypothetical protein
MQPGDRGRGPIIPASARPVLLRLAIGCAITALAVLLLLAIGWYVYMEVTGRARGMAPA